MPHRTFISIELTLSLITCISCLLIHFSQHFRLQCCNKRYTKPVLDIRQSIVKLTNKFSNNPTDANATNSSLGNTLPIDYPQFVPRKSSIFSRETLKHPEDAIQWCIRAIDNEEFDFFPRSFLWYQLFLVCLLILILIRFISLIHNNQLIDNIININHIVNRLDNDIYVLDWIIIYGILLLINWECLFAFYRYYSTLYTAKYFDQIDNIVVFKLFARYCVLFIILFIAQIHFYFWIFPILIVGMSFFVLFCTWKTSDILIGQCKQMELMMENFGPNGHVQNSMRKSIYFMRYSSIVSSICSIIYLSLFLILSRNIIFYLPILWSIITIAFTLNFIRNRRFLLGIFHKLTRPKRLSLAEVKSRSNYVTSKQLSPTIDSGQIDIKNKANENENDINDINDIDEPKNYKLQIENSNEIKIDIDNNDISKNRPYTIKHNEGVTLSVQSDILNNTNSKQHEKNVSKTMTQISKTVIINSVLETKVNGPDFGLDILYDINGEIISDNNSNDTNDSNDSADSDEGNFVIVNEEIPFDFINEDGDLFVSNPVTREPSPINSPLGSPRTSNTLVQHNTHSNNSKLNSEYFKSSNSKSTRIQKLTTKIKPKFSNSSNKNKSNSLHRNNSNNKPNIQNYTAPINRLDSTRKRKIIKVRNKWKKRFKKFANKKNKNHENDNKNTTTTFGKSQSTKTKFAKVRFNDPKYLKPHAKHRRIQSDKPSINNQQANSNPFPSYLHSPSNSKQIIDNTLPKIGVNYSDPVTKKHTSLIAKPSNHIQSSSFQMGENKNMKLKKSRRTLSRKLIFDKLPNKMQQLNDNEKKKVEEFANIYLCMSLHGFCAKDTFFQFKIESK